MNGFAELVADFKAQMDGEIDLKKGENVKILEVKDTGCLVEKIDGLRGICPIKFLKKVDSTNQAPASRPIYDQPVYEPSKPVYDKPVYEVPGRILYDQPSQVYEHMKPDEDRPYCRALYDFK